MSALAEPAVDAPPDDRLARRNALVLAVTQALAGGNNVGAGRDRRHRRRRCWRPTRALATLPLSVLVLGMWMGTLPVGVLARRYGRRTALQIGTVCGVLTGLICCAAVLQGSFLPVQHRRRVQRLLCGGASVLPLRRRRHGERRLPAEGDLLGAARRRRSAPWSVRSSSSPPRISGRPISSPRAISARRRSP